VMNKGRFREFYQCDFDIAGEYDLMVPDSEAVALICEILDELQVGNYKVKINHRKFLDGMFEVCGVPADKFRTICSSVDKLDKTPWLEVKKEMVEQKQLPEDVADKIGKYVQLSGEPLKLLDQLKTDEALLANPSASTALNELGVLFKFTEAFGVNSKVLFDLSLARGLDYYTGVIYEAVLTDAHQVGSISGGGRYDDLIGIFGSTKIPAVGFSIGIERIFSILESRAKKDPNFRTTDTEVIIASIDEGQLGERMKICADLWKNKIKAEFLYKENPKLKPQLSYAEQQKIPFAVIFGSREVEKGEVQVKQLATRQQETVPRANLAEVLKKKIEEHYKSLPTQNW